ncbi:ROK family protein [Candidatus Pacearchaeota archaeon]|nr:MAG: ROK family protein [Candidatus Pacearchaeota archaeon]
MRGVLALDIGGTNIRVAKVRASKIGSCLKVPTPKTRQRFWREVVSQIKSYVGEAKLDGICVSIAGFQRHGRIIYSPHLRYLEGCDVRRHLAQKFACKVWVENDAHCAGLAERYYGVGKRYKNFVMLTLGTGIGGAIFIDGKLYLGKGIGCEAGHMIICGKKFEDIASGRASVEIARKHGLNMESLEVERLARKGNKKALAVYREVGYNLGVGLANLVYILDPEAIIIGGGFSRVKFIWKEMIKTMEKLDKAKRRVPVLKAKFGDDAGLVGAALLPRVHL